MRSEVRGPGYEGITRYRGKEYFAITIVPKIVQRHQCYPGKKNWRDGGREEERKKGRGDWRARERRNGREKMGEKEKK